MAIKVSIIVPIYNVQRYLCQCVDSLLNQTYKNIEIILVDDGSPDECPRICDEYASKDDRIIVIHKSNGGLVSARKAGAIVASGSYVACVDGDDWVADDYIDEFCTIIEAFHPDVVCCGYIAATEEKYISHVMPERKGFYDKEALKAEVYPHLVQAVDATAFLPTVWAKIIKKEIYLKHQMAVPDKISMGEDGACTIPILLDANNMYIAEKCMYYYRSSDSSMTRVKKPLPWSNYDLIVKHLIDCTSSCSFDVKEQLFRRIVHSFFTVAKSRFNQRIPYKIIRTEIKNKMEEPITKEAIQNCKFKGSIKAILIQTSIKAKSIALIAILNRFW